jgi:hypothetical protein
VAVRERGPTPRFVQENADSPKADRVGSSPALPATDHRGKVWKPVLGFP